MSRLSLLLILLAFPIIATAAPREVLLEWEQDPEAVTYEIEIGELGKVKPLKSARGLTGTEWQGPLEAGRYWMRIRGRDDRGVPGEWTDKVEFQATLQPVDILQPKPEEIVKADDDKEDVEFKWQPTPQATGYLVTVMNEEGKVIVSRETKEAKASFELQAAIKYSWQVQAIDHTGTPGAKADTTPTFILLGEAIDKPEIIKPASGFVRKVDFEKPKHAQSIKVQIERLDKEKNEWMKVTEGELKKSKIVPFKQEWPGGEYKVTAVAEGKYRAPSSVSEVKFEVESGPRTVEAEHRAIMRTIIERTNDWYFTASYIVSMISYRTNINRFGTNQDTINSKFNTFTGTGLLGIGRFWKKSPWGFFASIDYGGMTVEPDGTSVKGVPAITNFLGMEASGLYRWAFGRSDVRLRAGLFGQEVPELVDPLTGEMKVFNTIGPVLGAEYVYSLSPKLVVQASIGARVPTGKSSAGQAIETNINWHTGLTAGMRVTDSITGLAGISYRNQTYEYKNEHGDMNSITMSGPFLQLNMEYDF